MAYIPAPMYWGRIPEKYRLVGYRCKKCGAVNFPYRSACRQCGSKADYEEVKLSWRGKVYSYSIIASGGSPPEFANFERAVGPYPIAIVELDEGLRIMAQLTECDPGEVKIGMEVEATLRKVYEDEGIIRYGIKFKPVRVKQ